MKQKLKWSYLRLHTNHALDFGRVIDIVSILYRTEHQVRVLCVGGDMAILQSSVKIDYPKKCYKRDFCVSNVVPFFSGL